MHGQLRLSHNVAAVLLFQQKSQVRHGKQVADPANLGTFRASGIHRDERLVFAGHVHETMKRSQGSFTPPVSGARCIPISSVDTYPYAHPRFPATIMYHHLILTGYWCNIICGCISVSELWHISRIQRDSCDSRGKAHLGTLTFRTVWSPRLLVKVTSRQSLWA